MNQRKYFKTAFPRILNCKKLYKGVHYPVALLACINTAKLANKEGVPLPHSRTGEIFRIHHWNWNKADFANIVVDERHLFFVPKKYHTAAQSGIHQFLQDLGRHPTRDRIPFRWVLDVEAPWLN